MATDRYVDSTVEAANRATARAQLSGDAKLGVVTTEKTAADNNGSVLRVFKGVPVETVITDMKLLNDAITGLTGVNCGIYQTNDGAVLDADLFKATLNAAAGSATGFDLLGSVNLAHRAMTIKELYEAVNTSETLTASSVDIALTLTTAGTNTGTITVIATGVVQ